MFMLERGPPQRLSNLECFKGPFLDLFCSCSTYLLSDQFSKNTASHSTFKQMTVKMSYLTKQLLQCINTNHFLHFNHKKSVVLLFGPSDASTVQADLGFLSQYF